MRSRITPRLIELTYEAALKSFWRKSALRKFLRSSNISDRFLSTWNEESKREFLDRLFGELLKSDKGKQVLLQMSRNLSEQATFPDLRNWEDSDQKISQAHKSVQDLKAYLKSQEMVINGNKEKEEVKKKAREMKINYQRSETDLMKLQDRLESLIQIVGTQKGGYEFQDWFYDLLDFFDVDNRRPYNSKGRQIDGSITIYSTTYLVELKFTKYQADATDIDSLRAKVEDKIDNTMGIFVSISGFSEVAIKEASGRRGLLLLLDNRHIYLCLRGVIGFKDLLLRVSRHASQTGQAYLEISKFDV